MIRNILVVDGGGIRGIIPVQILNNLLRGYARLVGAVDLFVGTSTGAIIALALAAGVVPQDIVNLYVKNGAAIFKTTTLGDIESAFGLLKAKYDPAVLRGLLRKIFGNLTLADLKYYVVVPTFCLDDRNPDSNVRCWKPIFWTNIPGIATPTMLKTKVVDLAMMTSAAPTFFPEEQDNVDGGTVANNPAMVAWVMATVYNRQNNPGQLINLLSMGTGFRRYHIDGLKQAGDIQWSTNISKVFMAGQEMSVDMLLQLLLPGSYLRVNPLYPLGTDFALDDYRDSWQLLSMANATDVKPILAWLSGVGW